MNVPEVQDMPTIKTSSEAGPVPVPSTVSDYDLLQIIMVVLGENEIW